MEKALLESLVSGSGTDAQIMGAIIMVLLFLSTGLMAAIGGVFIVRHILHGRWEQYFWAVFIAVIAAFYISFAAFYSVSRYAWDTELMAFVVFLILAAGGLFSRLIIALGYALHGIWDLTHSLSGVTFDTLSLTVIPIGYGVFCFAFDFTIAVYALKSNVSWAKSGKMTAFPRSER